MFIEVIDEQRNIKHPWHIYPTLLSEEISNESMTIMEKAIVWKGGM